VADHVVIRVARTRDAACIVELVRGGFDERLIGAFIYGCRGIARYVEQQILDAEHSDTRYFVAERDHSIVAAIEMRMLGDALFLNYIAVAPDARRDGLGSRVLGEAIAAVRTPAHERLMLDVLDTNRAAIAWYDALGLATESMTCWYEMPLELVSGDGEVVVTGLSQARVVHRELGFSQITLVGEDYNATVGMLGDRWFRVTNAAVLMDAAMLRRLRALDPNRCVLALLPDDAAVPSACQVIARTQRRSGSVADVVARLETR
jgi:ribosomal protein S18 acetylase RimI-like enzyme